MPVLSLAMIHITDGQIMHIVTNVLQNLGLIALFNLTHTCIMLPVVTDGSQL